MDSRTGTPKSSLKPSLGEKGQFPDCKKEGSQAKSKRDVVTLWNARGRCATWRINAMMKGRDMGNWFRECGVGVEKREQLERFMIEEHHIWQWIQHRKRERRKIQDWFPQSCFIALISCGTIHGPWNAGGRMGLLEGGMVVVGTLLREANN